ncbi:hypothetical protein BGZ65_010104 [Modicella reniformis]|uniref:Tudor domain-containing protein n=1 Tax=Modicella reniformis TaxID=1440133 RepID=A0A9P6SRQ7_9FUNG|nr:hypothetical protein BGZ65_010104 [Modicella reniformis]
MDASELNSYKEQVATIESALQADPNNTELLTLKSELLDLISLTESLLLQQQQQQQQLEETHSSFAAATRTDSPSLSSSSATSSPNRSSTFSTPPPPSLPLSITSSKPSGTSTAAAVDPSKQPIYQPPPPPPRQWVVGDKCRALYADDGRYYEATILSIGNGGQVYSVQYKGYEASAPSLVGPQELKAPHDPKKYQKYQPAVGGGVGGTEDGEKKKRAAVDGGTGTGTGTGIVTGTGAGTGAAAAAAGGGGGGGMNKKKKITGPSEQVQKQQAWQSFSKGGAGAKKTKGAAPMVKKSIFASPDTPDGKVGVVGSGKGMTHFQQRGKHIYGQSNQESSL